MKWNRRVVAALLVGLVLAGAAFGGGYLLGERSGRADGYRIGLRRGEVVAARKTPPQVREQGHGLAELSALPIWAELDPLEEAEATALAQLLNKAPSPCRKEARRGLSLATTLLADEGTCLSAPEQVRLALAALRSLQDPAEALAVLRVERRARPETEGRPRRGNPDGDVTVVEWGDFQCPYCVRSQGLIDGLLNSRDDVALVFKHMPLSFHPAALPAALAVEAAHEQGRFWEMHDALFALGKKLGDRVKRDQGLGEEGPVPFEDLAAELGLDVPTFRADVRSPRIKARVESDVKEARRLGVTGTPSFFVGNRKAVERLNGPVLSALVDKASAEQNWVFSWDLKPPPPGAGTSSP